MTAPPVRPAPKRTRYVAAAVVCGLVVVVAIVLVVVLADNVVYFRTVSEAVADRKNQGDDRFRIGGEVVLSSVDYRARRFDITDGEKTVTVAYSGDVPPIFKRNVRKDADVPVLCEGRWGRGLTFDSDRILIKHGEDYEPPKVDSENAPGAANS